MLASATRAIRHALVLTVGTSICPMLPAVQVYINMRHDTMWKIIVFDARFSVFWTSRYLTTLYSNSADAVCVIFCSAPCINHHFLIFQKLNIVVFFA
jgi:uncharacterized protein YqgC (DUF456 family)